MVPDPAGLDASLASAAISAATDSGTAGAPNTQTDPAGFSTLAKHFERSRLLTSDGPPFFSRELNHIDTASLRHPENLHVWQEKYSGSTTTWIRESATANCSSARLLRQPTWERPTGLSRRVRSQSCWNLPNRAVGRPACRPPPSANTPQNRLSRGMKPCRTPDARAAQETPRTLW